MANNFPKSITNSTKEASQNLLRSRKIVVEMGIIKIGLIGEGD